MTDQTSGTDNNILSVNLNKKRPPKAQTISFITNQFAALVAKIPGSTKENIKAQFALGNHYLFESEVKDIIIANKDKAGFNAKAFVELLQFTGAIKAGSTPRIGEGMTLINSIERATQVAKNPADAKVIQEYMTKMTDLRDKVTPLILGTCSIALKNPKSKKSAEKHSEEKLEASQA